MVTGLDEGTITLRPAAVAEDRNERPERFYRIANEVPTLLMIGIVILVVVRPF